MGEASSVNLPPGFRFQPTDEELVVHFLYPKASLLHSHPHEFIPDLDLCSLSPWELNGKALSSENGWYFFSQMPENRATKIGYWKQAVDIDNEPIFTSGSKVGIKKYFVFCTGEAPDGIETNWVMQEYHLYSSSSTTPSYKRKEKRKFADNKWVLCRVHERKANSTWDFSYKEDYNHDQTELSCLDEVFLSFDDDLDEVNFPC